MRDVINESSLTYLIFSDPQDLSQVNDDGAPFDAGNNVDFPDDGHEVDQSTMLEQTRMPMPDDLGGMVRRCIFTFFTVGTENK